jgi:hypothetical protein
MKRICKIKTIRLVLPILLLCISLPGVGWSIEPEQVSVGPINSAFAIMLKGQTKTYTVTSDFFPDLMIVGLAVYGNWGFGGGILRVSVDKKDTSGELIGVLQVGAYSSVTDQESVKYAYRRGITPCTIAVNGRFYGGFGYGVIISGLVASLEPGPYSYTLTISFD